MLQQSCPFRNLCPHLVRTSTIDAVSFWAAQEAAAARAAKEGPTELQDVDTDDEAEDENAAYEAWRIRELTRIRKDRAAREAAQQEQEEKER